MINGLKFFFLALAHQYSFPHSPFQRNDESTDRDWWGKFLAMLDMEDVRQDLSEHFGVVGDRIVGSFRNQHSYMQYSEADCLITPAQLPAQVVAVSRVKDKNYGTYSSEKSNIEKQKSQAIGKNNKNYRVANIEDNETPRDSSQSSGQGTSSRNTTTSMTQSTTSTSSFGINVRGIENDPVIITYRNPDM